MSFSRLKYDTGNHQKEDQESMGPGLYTLNTPVQCSQILPKDPRLRAQKQGVSQQKNVDWRFYSGPIDVESELYGINRPNSRCPQDKFIPGCQEKIIGGYNCEDNAHDFNIGGYNIEDTRLSNPPSTLRGTGINRFEPLCLDPQDRVLFPCSFNVNTDLLVKDNHRPSVPEPVEYKMPKPKPLPCIKTNQVCGNYTLPMHAYDVCGGGGQL